MYTPLFRTPHYSKTKTGPNQKPTSIIAHCIKNTTPKHKKLTNAIS